jgi:prepilin-type processing-associated H-X9-DG protein
MVVMVLLLVGGLLLVGIRKANESASRMNCGSRLKQIGLTILNYQSTNNYFPPATVANSNLPPDRRLSWLTGSLPYLEGNDLYQCLERQKAWDADENRFLALTVFKPYVCSSFPLRPPNSTLVPAHYIGITGLGEDAAMLSVNHPCAGFFAHDRKLVPADIPGRTSTLMVVVETTRTRSAWTAGGPTTARGLVPEEPPYLGIDRQFGGSHPGGTNILFADGSVRLVRDSMDRRVLEAMATIKGSKEAEFPGEE